MSEGSPLSTLTLATRALPVKNRTESPICNGSLAQPPNVGRKTIELKRTRPLTFFNVSKVQTGLCQWLLWVVPPLSGPHCHRYVEGPGAEITKSLKISNTSEVSLNGV